MNTYRVIAEAEDKTGLTIAFVTLTNKMDKESAEDYLAWVKAGPKLKWLVEKELYNNANVVNVVFCLDTE